jgi:hypothetical protein
LADDGTARIAQKRALAVMSKKSWRLTSLWTIAHAGNLSPGNELERFATPLRFVIEPNGRPEINPKRCTVPFRDHLDKIGNRDFWPTFPPRPMLNLAVPHQVPDGLLTGSATTCRINRSIAKVGQCRAPIA